MLVSSRQWLKATFVPLPRLKRHSGQIRLDIDLLTEAGINRVDIRLV